MSNIEITFTDLWVLWLVIPALVLTVVPLFFIKKKRRRSLKYISSLIMRCTAVMLVLLLLSGFTVTSRSELTSVVIVVDLSDSTAASREQMRDYVNEFTEKLDGDTQIAMVGFGYNTVTQVPMDFLENADTEDGYYYIKRVPTPSATATNIDGALEFAAELLPDGTNKRILLLSDGLETDGHAETKARELAGDGIRVDVIELAPYASGSGEIQLSGMDVPQNAYTGDPINVTVLVESNISETVSISLYDGEELIEEKTADVVSGENEVVFETTAGTSGVHSYRAEAVSANDTVAENNMVYSYVKVAGDPSILIIDGTTEEEEAEAEQWQEAHEMVNLLEAVDYQTTVMLPGDFPRSVSGLRDYDAVILMNVNMDDMPSEAAETLKEYVSRLGRGLFTTGGQNTYIYGSMEKTPMEDMLPINMRLDEDELPTSALMILIDNSSSMAGNNLRMAKKGAIKSINSLSDKDYVGVITFAENAEVVCDLTSMYEYESIIEEVADIKSSFGTKFHDAVEEAQKQLKDFDAAEVKHVIILSDGNPTDSGYAEIIQEMKRQGIMTSTISVGRDANTSLMRQLSVYGGGKYYEVRDPEDLPGIMLDAALATKGNYVNEVSFVPDEKSYSQTLIGASPIPQLDGYISASVKDNATTVLCYTDPESGNERPIFAEWQYGLGRVASFTSDLAGRWSSRWLAADEGVTFVRNVVSAILPVSNERTSLITKIDVFSRSVEITVTTEDTYGEKTLEATLYPPGNGAGQEMELAMTSPGIHTGSVDISKEGVFTLMIWQYDPAADDPDIPVDTTEQAFCVSYSPEYDVFAQPTDLMANIAMLTGGLADASPDELANVPAIPMEDVLDTFTPIAVAAALLLLGDILVRKLKLKDLKHVLVSIYRGTLGRLLRRKADQPDGNAG